MKKTFTLIATTVSLLLPASATAQEAAAPETPAPGGNVCKESYEQAQEQMKPNQAESKLLVARESLRTCIRSSCKDWMVSDCSKWLGEVDARIPSVVFSAKTSNGADLTDTKVTQADGTTLVESLDGRTIELEPGAHDFVFLAADGRRVEKRALVREGEKAQTIAAIFEVPEEKRLVNSTLVRASDRVPPTTPPLRYVGYGAVGLGVVSLAVGGIFGLMTISKTNNLDCDASGCDKEPLADANRAASISNIGFIAGGVLTAAGAALIFFTPSKKIEARVSQNGLSVGGRW